MTRSDSELIARVLVEQDAEAFGEIVLTHQSAVRRFLRSLCRDDAWADDLAQEAFLQAHRRMGSFRGQATLRTWLLGIAYNRYRNARRARREEPVGEPPEGEAETGGRLSDLRQDLGAALARLSEEERTVICLSYQQALSHPEIAAATGMPLGTVKTHLARGKGRLRELLSAWDQTT